MKHRILTLTAALLLAGATAIGMTACDGIFKDLSETQAPATEAATSDNTEAPTDEAVVTDPATEAPTDPISEETEAPRTEAPTEPPTEAPTETIPETAPPTIKEELGLEVHMSDLNKLMQPIFSGTTTINETVMFIDKGEIKSLLYPIGTIESVTSYDGKIIYEEGKDYVIEDGKLKVTETSSIPCITAAKYYNAPGSLLMTSYNGQNVYTHWGEGRAMTDWQVNVNYTHAEGWEHFKQKSELEVYQNFIKKLQAGEDVTVFFYGDSITFGANASWINGYAPHKMSYPILVVQSLADLFDYTVKYVKAGLPGTSNVPATDYVAGDRGTITYVNTAVGGWTSQNGVDKIPTYVNAPVEANGCDLFILGFGMNDAGVSPNVTKNNSKKIVDAVHALEPDANVVLVSTMVPNPNATNGWYGNQPKQESQLLRLAQDYRNKENKAVAVARMTSVSLAVLEEKDFHDYSGNNINHPNDYFVRIYAQTLLQTILGYENMD